MAFISFFIIINNIVVHKIIPIDLHITKKFLLFAEPNLENES